jgi:hypothetical protein
MPQDEDPDSWFQAPRLTGTHASCIHTVYELKMVTFTFGNCDEIVASAPKSAQ